MYISGLSIALPAAAVAMGMTVAAGATMATQAAARRGHALFTGGVAPGRRAATPLKARLRGHPSALPPEVVVCANCHDGASRGAAAAKAAPQLDRAFLLEPRVRRNGPASSYDQATFCRMLRTGVDPVYILGAREMPVYEIDDGSCADLWAFLTETGRAPTVGAPPDRAGPPR